MKFVTQVWESESAWAAAARGILTPASMLYRGATAVRNSLYDRGALSVARPPIPTISVGNLAVGGTGKTPVSAWIASELRARGASPAIVMRGYGDDEPGVHALLNPGIPVVTNADRVAGVKAAVVAGADIAVLDDAFQHRRIARSEDVVLVSADRWRDAVHLLPAGPWRESPSALSRASLLLITRKAVGSERAEELRRRLAPMTRSGSGAVAALNLVDLRDVVTGESRPLSSLRGKRVVVAAGIGDPQSLATQMSKEGAQVEMRIFPDHHVYDFSDITHLTAQARAFDYIICTLKDAVKLGPHWPRNGPPLWYVSLGCTIESGSAEVSAMLSRMIAARSTLHR